MDKYALQQILRPEVVVFVVPIIAILAAFIAGTTVKIVKMVHTHNERIAMIRQGIHPDYPPEDVEKK